mgnify:FL=1
MIFDGRTGLYEYVIRIASAFLRQLGGAVIMTGLALQKFFLPPYRVKEFLRQLDFIGTQSTFLIVTTGAFTGMVTALQGYNAMHRYGAETLVGATVALSLARELGPVLSALMVTGRVGSAMTAELGAMRNTQQIDALSSMAVDPIHFLVTPRIAASILTLPFLASIYSFSGMVGAYIVSVKYLDIDQGAFMSGIRSYVDVSDVTHGLAKAVVFGLIISMVACYKGFYATGGSRGVGIATTKAVVISSILILVGDYVMTSIMF